MKSKAYSVYLLFCFAFSLLFSMATVLSVVYHLECAGLDPLQVVLVGTVSEASCFLFEIPTGIVADLYSRRRSVLIGVFLYGAGFILEGAIPWVVTILLAQVVWGCGDTFITGALEAWISSENEGKPMDRVFLRGGQLRQAGGILGVVFGTALANISLQLPIVLAGVLFILLGLVLLRIMPEAHFTPAQIERGSVLGDMLGLFRINLRFVKGAPVLLALLGITLCGGLASEGFDRLSSVHFLNDSTLPALNGFSHITWFGIMSLIGSVIGILAEGLLITHLEQRGSISRKGVVLFTSAGYIAALLLFAFGHSFWFLFAMFLAAGLMRTLREPVIAAWMNDHVEEPMRATVFSMSGQIDALGQMVGGPAVGWIARSVSIPWGLGWTALLMLPSLALVMYAERMDKKRLKG